MSAYSRISGTTGVLLRPALGCGCRWKARCNMLDEYPEMQTILAAAWEALAKAGKSPLEATAEEAYCSLVELVRADPWSSLGRWWLYRTYEEMQWFAVSWRVYQCSVGRAGVL